MRLPRIVLASALLIAGLLAAGVVHARPLGQIPTVPHPAEGNEDCLQCHAEGQFKPAPADHAGRTTDTCLLCHKLAEVEPAPAIPHSTDGREDCVQCHGAGASEPFPTDHAGRTSDTCLACHRPTAAQTTESAQPTASPQAATTTPQQTPSAQPAVKAATGTEPPSLQSVPTPIREPVLFEQNSCIACHKQLGGNQAQIASEWDESVHAERGVGCVSCHGGDPTQQDAGAAMSPAAGFLGPLPRERIPGLCGSCHTRVDLMRQFNLPTDQLDQYWQSQHGQGLLQGDTKVATCFDCHGGHRILKASDPGSTVYPTNEPAMCAGCHADAATMGSYGIPTSQYDQYTASVHGQALKRQDLRAPTCSTCHGKHGATPPGYRQVSNVCGQCHSLTEDYYLQGAHRIGMTDEAAPRCVTCHGQHDVMPASSELFVGTEDRHCGSCHAPGSALAGQVEEMYGALTEADTAYASAEKLIATATERRLLMAEQEELLQRGKTPLIESRALQHTVKVVEVKAKAAESLAVSQQALASAEQALRGLSTRRIGMIVAFVVILITVVALVLIKRELDRELEAKRAQRSKSD